jgi:hypothetical protein
MQQLFFFFFFLFDVAYSINYSIYVTSGRSGIILLIAMTRVVWLGALSFSFDSVRPSDADGGKSLSF